MAISYEELKEVWHFILLFLDECAVHPSWYAWLWGSRNSWGNSVCPFRRVCLSELLIYVWGKPMEVWRRLALPICERNYIWQRHRVWEERKSICKFPGLKSFLLELLEFLSDIVGHSLLCWPSHRVLAPCHCHNVKSAGFTSVLCSFGQDPILGMKKIASFFGFSLCEEDFSRIAKKTSFKAMKEKSNETHGKFGDVLFRKGKSLQMEIYLLKQNSRRSFEYVSLLSHELIGLSGWVLSGGATCTKSFCCWQDLGAVCEKLIRMPVLMSSVIASVLLSFSVAALVI